MQITTLLLDADGVIQGCQSMLDAMTAALGGRATFAELSDVERPSITGRGDLRANLTAFVAERDIPATVDDLLAIWHSMRPLPGAMEIVDAPRAYGVRAFLATNQQPLRGAFMQQNLGYERHFDGAYYSYQMGVAKPDQAYFEHIVADLALDPGRTLFVDDMAENVEGARQVGLVAELHDWHSGVDGLAGIFRRRGLVD
jgi:putative hydrolase of the HAD superfamily